MRVTINDIAELAGVSKTTVSFAFNDPKRISAATRERILTIAEEFGYVPDPVARTMSSKRLGTIGFLVPQNLSIAFQNPYMGEILRGIGATCEPHALSITVIPPVEGSLQKSVRSAAVDGLVTLGLLPTTETARTIRQRHIPFVTIDGGDDSDIPTVNVQDQEAAYTVMRHILNLGHREIGILDLGPTHDTEVEHGIDTSGSHYSGIGERRDAGYAQALTEYGLSIDSPSIRRVYGHASRDGAIRAAVDLVDRPDRPTAVVAMSDLMALGVYHVAHHRGIRIPEELSVAGFDDIPAAELVRPPLTTLSQPGSEKGRQAATVLLDLLNGRPPKSFVTYIDTQLIVRESTAPPADAL